MSEGEDIKVGARVFCRRSDSFDLLATVKEIKGDIAVVKPEWPHDGTLTEWPIADLRLAGIFE